MSKKGKCENEEKSAPNKKSFSFCIKSYLRGIENLEECARTYIPVALETSKKRLEKIKLDFLDVKNFTKNKKIKDEKKIAHVLLPRFQQFEKLLLNPPQELLSRSFFATIFSLLDAFIADMLKYIYQNRPELFYQIDKTIKFRDLLDLESIEEAKEQALEQEVETMVRDSYVERFKTLERKFETKLREFENWPAFVECSQRRNLIVHCDGVVSDQYIKICKSEGWIFDKKIVKGVQLKIDPDYLFKAFFLAKEVGFKLAQVLWRINFKDKIKDADTELLSYVYDLLLAEDWKLSKNIGKFGFEHPSKDDDVYNQMIRINYAQALKWSGSSDQALKIINEKDWRSSSLDFQLAVAVLKNDFATASKIMKRIGVKGDHVNEKSYQSWPLFREFRKSTKFLQSYRKIFKRDFEKTINKRAVKELEEIFSKTPKSSNHLKHFRKTNK